MPATWGANHVHPNKNPKASWAESVLCTLSQKLSRRCCRGKCCADNPRGEDGGPLMPGLSGPLARAALLWLSLIWPFGVTAESTV